MSEALRLRRGVLALVGLSALGLVAELLLADHTHDPVQWVPFGLSGLAVLGAGLAWADKHRPALAVAAVLVLGGAFGIWEHLEHNYAFEAEIRPTAGASELVWAALRGGSPLLAPGAIALLGAMLALASWHRDEQG